MTMTKASTKEGNAVKEDTVSDNHAIGQEHVIIKRILSKSVLGLISLFMLIPILIVLFSWTQPVADIWQHMTDYVLPQVIKNTAILLLMVTVIAGSIGTALAWITSMYRFPDSGFFVGADVAASDARLCAGLCHGRNR